MTARARRTRPGPTTHSFRARAWWARLSHSDQEQIIVWLLENPPRPPAGPIEHAFRELHEARWEPVR